MKNHLIEKVHMIKIICFTAKVLGVWGRGGGFRCVKIPLVNFHLGAKIQWGRRLNLTQASFSRIVSPVD